MKVNYVLGGRKRKQHERDYVEEIKIREKIVWKTSVQT